MKHIDDYLKGLIEDYSEYIHEMPEHKLIWKLVRAELVVARDILLKDVEEHLASFSTKKDN